MLKNKLAQVKAELEKEIEVVLADARKQIEETIEKDGQYVHNILSIILRSVAVKIGYEYANNLVEEFELEEIYNIPKVKDKP